MKTTIRLEEAGMLALAIYLNSFLSYPVWLFWAFFLAPDIGMLGYAVNTRFGALLYNAFHHKGLGLALYIIGNVCTLEPLQFIGLLLFGHSAFDRLLGYGLKYPDNFKNTHLGWIGKTQ